MAEQESKKTIGERSIYTQSLVNLVKDTKPGDIVTFEKLGEEIGMGCRPHEVGYSYWHTAKKILEKEHNIVMDNVKTIGYKHREKAEVGQESTSLYKDRIKSVNRRLKRRLDTLAEEWDNLPDKARVGAVMTRTLVAFTDHALKARNVAKLEAPAAGGKALGFGQTIELFEK